MRRILGLAWTAALLAGAAAAGASAQEAPKSIKVGYVISLSGPQSAGAMLTTVPNYRLWVDEVNKAGGLMLKKYDKRVPIEVERDRRPLQQRGHGAPGRAADDRRQGRHRALAVGHRAQPAGGADLQQVRLSADHGHGGHRQDPGAGAALRQRVLAAGPADRGRERPRRAAERPQEEGPAQGHGGAVHRAASLRLGVPHARQAGAGQGRLQDRLRDHLSARRLRPVARRSRRPRRPTPTS